MAIATAGIADQDIEALLTGIYGSAVGCLQTYNGSVVAGQDLAMAATTIDRPGRGYSGCKILHLTVCFHIIRNLETMHD